jgi:GTP-binding protein YchF
MRLGITGLPKTGKTTVFNLLTGSELDTSKFAASVAEMNRGQATVPDVRLDNLAEIFKSKKKVPVAIEFLDFGGISLGSGDGDGKLIGDLRSVDALVHTLRAFDDEELSHSAGDINPRRDADNFQAELIINDLMVVEKKLEKLEKAIQKIKDEALVKERDLLAKVHELLENETPLRSVEFDEADMTVLRGYGFLSMKPLLFGLNVAESEAGNLDAMPEKWNLADLAEDGKVAICTLCAQIEEEISRLDEEEREMFMTDLGITDLGSQRLIRTAYELLGLITFFTGSDKDAHAWTIRRGDNSVAAAGAIHSDLARGFIRADVVGYEHLIAAGSVGEARNQGNFHLEGKDYIVQDGDYVLVRFNV